MRQTAETGLTDIQSDYSQSLLMSTSHHKGKYFLGSLE
jgi:hypothetical protein